MGTLIAINPSTLLAYASADGRVCTIETCCNADSDECSACEDDGFITPEFLTISWSVEVVSCCPRATSSIELTMTNYVLSNTITIERVSGVLCSWVHNETDMAYGTYQLFTPGTDCTGGGGSQQDYDEFQINVFKNPTTKKVSLQIQLIDSGLSSSIFINGDIEPADNHCIQKYGIDSEGVINCGSLVIISDTGTASIIEGQVSAWNNSTTYNPGDKIGHAGVFYYCITTNSNQEPPDTAYWSPFT